MYDTGVISSINAASTDETAAIVGDVIKIGATAANVAFVNINPIKFACKPQTANRKPQTANRAEPRAAKCTQFVGQVVSR